MGQYYKPYLRFEDGSEETYSSQNAIFKTVHGIPAEEDLDFRTGPTTLCYPEDYFKLFSGLKLTEHSWYGNDFVNGVVERIEGRPAVVAWVGDYADEEEDFKGVEGYTPEIYGRVWPRREGDPRIPEAPFPSVPGRHDDGFLVNRTKGLYIDFAVYYRAAKAKDGGRWWCIHPLPLLTAIGNGRGNGDYHAWGLLSCSKRSTRNEEMVGAWAMDVLEYAHERPAEGYAEVDYARYAFDSTF